MEPILTAVIVGGAAGAVKSLLGYAPSEDKFNPQKFLKTLGLATIAGSMLVYMTLIKDASPVVDAKFYMESFFLSFGATSMLDNLAGASLNKKITN